MYFCLDNNQRQSPTPMKHRIFYLFLFLIPLLSDAQNAAMPDTGWVRKNYLKTEQSIEMRDGVKLYTAIYTPRDTDEKLSDSDATDALFLSSLWCK